MPATLLKRHNSSPRENYSPQISVRIPADEYDRLMTAVREHDRPISRIIREALRSWFDAQHETAV